ncbi:MAG: aldo/keto reductase [Chlamydiales bacterium]|nr:aldo/keto reductase [Chlamydiales bacterium]
MEYVEIPRLGKKVCRVGLGTWAIGGWLWGGSDEQESIWTILRSLDCGINLIDTAPVYGFGRSEEIVGKALKAYGNRDEVCIATKAGINWTGAKPFRESSKERILVEIDLSLKRLGVERIDLYQIHWPDPQTPFEESAEAMQHLLREGKIGAIRVSNFTAPMMEEFSSFAPLSTLQPPYNLFEREIEKSEIPYCRKNGVAVLGYGALCRGLLSGRMHEGRRFEGDDIRKIDPKFQQPRFSQYLDCVKKLEVWVREKHGKTLLELAVRWIFDQGVEIALWGARRPDQLNAFGGVWNWKLSQSDKKEIDTILSESLINPVGPEFMAPPEERRAIKA